MTAAKTARVRKPVAGEAFAVKTGVAKKKAAEKGTVNKTAAKKSGVAKASAKNIAAQESATKKAVAKKTAKRVSAAAKPSQPPVPKATRATGDVLSTRALNRSLLARQALLQRIAVPIPQLVERLAGLQAQAPNPPYLGLWTRLQSFRLDALTQLMHARQVVRATMMRGTLHLVTAADYLAFRPVLQPALRRRTLQSTQAQALDGIDVDALCAEGRTLLTPAPLSATALGQALRSRWPGHDSAELARLVRSIEPLVHVPPAGCWDSHQAAAFTPAGVWLGAEPSGEGDAAALVLRYLAAFGPATPQDVAVWSGLTSTRGLLEALRPRLRVFRDELGRELFDLPDAPRPEPDTPAPVRLLPEFDNVLLSHVDRSRVFDPAYRDAIFTRNGLVFATFLIDGFVRGTWALKRDAKAAVATFSPFRRLSAAEREALGEEVARWMAVAAPDGVARDVRFEAP